MGKLAKPSPLHGEDCGFEPRWEYKNKMTKNDFLFFIYNNKKKVLCQKEINGQKKKLIF